MQKYHCIQGCATTRTIRLVVALYCKATCDCLGEPGWHVRVIWMSIAVKHGLSCYCDMMMSEYVDCGLPVDANYWDSQKAFSTVPYKWLMMMQIRASVKLCAHGLAKSRVAISDESFYWSGWKARVLQSSVLGPLALMWELALKFWSLPTGR